MAQMIYNIIGNIFLFGFFGLFLTVSFYEPLARLAEWIQKHL